MKWGARIGKREREVTLPYEFYLGATPVTQRQYERVIPGSEVRMRSWAEDRQRTTQPPRTHPSTRLGGKGPPTSAPSSPRSIVMPAF